MFHSLRPASAAHFAKVMLLPASHLHERTSCRCHQRPLYPRAGSGKSSCCHMLSTHLYVLQSPSQGVPFGNSGPRCCHTLSSMLPHSLQAASRRTIAEQGHKKPPLCVLILSFSCRAVPGETLLARGTGTPLVATGCVHMILSSLQAQPRQAQCQWAPVASRWRWGPSGCAWASSSLPARARGLPSLQQGWCPLRLREAAAAPLNPPPHLAAGSAGTKVCSSCSQGSHP